MEEADNGKNLHLTKLCVNGEKTAEAADELGEHFVRVTAEGRRMKLGDAEKHIICGTTEVRAKCRYGSAHVNDFIKEEIKNSGKGMAPDAASPFFRSSCYAKI